jgi:serine/threonine-protein kinase
VESTSIREGLPIGGKYVLEAPLGAGGMSVVWRARHSSLGHPVALKFLRASGPIGAQSQARFEREARLSARLAQQSRHITQVVDHGVHTDGTPFLVLEFLEGKTLADHLRDARGDLETAYEILVQLGRALRVAHAAGVVHRDIKPANVFLCRSEDDRQFHVKLLDFGIAKPGPDDAESTVTNEGQLVGTPSYMSPEQLTDGRAVDERTDLWAVAALVYRIVVGEGPFGSGREQEVALRVLTASPIRPSERVPGLPAAFDAWVDRALAKNRDLRFATVDEMIAALGRVVGAPADARVTTPWGPSEDHADVTRSAFMNSVGQPAPSRRFGRAVVAVGAATLVAATAVVLGTAGPRQTPSISNAQAANERATTDRPASAASPVQDLVQAGAPPAVTTASAAVPVVAAPAVRPKTPSVHPRPVRPTASAAAGTHGWEDPKAY